MKTAVNKSNRNPKSKWGLIVKIILTVASAVAGWHRPWPEPSVSVPASSKMRTITLIVIHCSATPQGRSLDFEECRREHIVHRRFKDIGYHFYITRDGLVHAGRPIEQPGAHCRNHNRRQSPGIRGRNRRKRP